MSAVGRRAVVAGAVLVAGASGAVIARADDARRPAAASAAEGGLAVKPVLIEKPAAVGPVSTVTVTNHSKAKLDITAKARPWVQSSSGAVSVDRRKTLSGIALSDGAFALAAGATKTITVTLRGTPAGGYTYGAVEVVGLPADASTRKGVVAGYRIISSVRLDPAVSVVSLKAGTAKVTGTGSARAVVLPVRNAGNTVQPVSGDVALKGPLGTRSRTLGAVRVLPGKTVNFLLSSAKSLPAGSYTATVRLKQGSTSTTITKKLTVKR